MGLRNNIKFFAEVIKSTVKARQQLNSPKAVNAMRAELANIYKEAAANRAVEIALKDAANPKVAQMAKDFEEMLEHPLAKKGLPQGKIPRIYIVSHDIPTANVINDEVVLITTKAIEICHEKELKGILGHELAHIVRGDMDAHKGLFVEKMKNQRMEFGADRLGAILSGEPQGLKSSLLKVGEGIKTGVAQIYDMAFSKKSFVGKATKQRLMKNMQNGSRTYPPHRSRAHSLDKLAAQIATPESRKFVEAEEMRRLEEIHGRQK